MTQCRIPRRAARGITHRIVAVTLAVSTGLLAGVLGAGQAAAHNTLIAADPADGSSLPAGPAQIRLTFDQPVQREFSTVTVTGPGDTRWDGGEPTVSGNSVTAPVRPLGPAGEYVVGYRIVSADGHPVSGTLRFRLTTAGTGTPYAAAPGSGSAAPADGRDDGMPVWPWIVAALLLLGAGVLVALRLSRPRRAAKAGEDQLT